MTEEKVLIENLKNGNHKTYEYVFNLYFKVLSVYAKKYVGDLDIAQDLVQEVFVRLYEKRKEINIHTSIKSFLYASVKNKSLDYIKVHKIRAQHNEKIKKEALADHEYNIEYIEETELQEKLYRAVNNLPGQNQKIFRLSRFDGLTNQEIADRTGLTKRTVETHISNALKKIREIVNYVLFLLFFIMS